MEIQISTSVKEIIKKLLHIHYENRRLNNTDNGSLWQWDYKGDEFIASYLGHIIHYVEGMIVTLRDRQGSAR